MADSVTTIAKQFVVTQSQQPPGDFEGQLWVDSDTGDVYKYFGGSWEQLSIDADTLKERDLELVADIAEARYGASVAQESMDDVLYDVFVDQSKISSSNTVNITTGQNGKVSVDQTMPEDFEDGDVSGWTGDTGNFSAQQSTVIEGSYTGELDRTGTRISVSLTQTETQMSTVKFWTRYGGQINSQDAAYYELRDGSGNVIAAIRYDLAQGENLEINGNVVDNGSSIQNTDHEWRITNLDYTNNTFDVEVVNGSGTTIYTQTGMAFSNTSATGFATIYLQNRMNSSDGSMFIDDIRVSADVTRSITSTQKNLGFTPGKALVQHNADIGAGLTYTLSDGSGNSKTISLNDVGSEVDISSFQDGDITVSVDLTGQTTLHEYGVMFV